MIVSAALFLRTALMNTASSAITVLYKLPMIQYIIRQAKRFAILLPGLIITYFAVQNIYPYFDRRVPRSAAIITTYIVAAYVLVPAIIRAYRIFRPASHLPLYCVTPDGFASDPLNIAIIGTRWQLITAMEKIGWHRADPHTVHNMAQVVLRTLLRQPYPNAPVSSLYLFGRKQDIAFEKPLNSGQFARHHVRFWATAYEREKGGEIGIHGIHWLHREEQVRHENLLWVGAASLDVGLTLIRHNLQLTHMIDPDTDKERELILNELKTAGLINSRTKGTKLGDAYRVVNRVWRGFLHTDGRLVIASLKKEKF